MRIALRIIEIPRDADGQVREPGGIDASCFDNVCVCKQNEKNKQPTTNAPMHC
jgi:hypothetical protein